MSPIRVLLKVVLWKSHNDKFIKGKLFSLSVMYRVAESSIIPTMHAWIQDRRASRKAHEG